ncbi:hypothetical protein M9Y10_042260 [Tritrichomonas musculus]|uniref:AAA+ ATPase domain-containing protein n=1 Tax=Tritrichomonas musculus TaxID=1915356 RepID=A0ABR2K9T8_9EUKA
MNTDQSVNEYNKVSSPDTNLYGQNRAFEKRESLDCNKIKNFCKEPVFTTDSINEILGQVVNYKKALDLGFVDTDEAKIKIAQIILAAISRIFLLIIGPTSSGKTFSVQAAAKIFENINIPNIQNRKVKYKRKNLSENTTRDDLNGQIVYDENLNKFVFKKGDFTEAFEKGMWLLLDEYSLAHPSALQAIEIAIDTGKLTLQEIGGTREINMNENFFLVCTTNPNNEEYSRYVLSEEFNDKFHILEFENFSNDEMKNILFNKCKKDNVKNDIQKIVETHKKYTGKDGPKCKNMYTLRDFDKASILINKGYDTEKIIDILYRTRAGEPLLTYKRDTNPFTNIIGFIPTDNRLIYGQLCLDCLHSGFNIIIESEYSSGTKYFAEALAKQYNPRLKPLIITMTNEIHESDLTEFSVPLSDDSNKQTKIKLKTLKGVIYRGMEEGRVVIINEAENGNTKVMESFNDITESNFLYDLNKVSDRIKNANPSFRIIVTLHSNIPNKLSTAFKNRFIHVVIHDKQEISNHFNFPKEIPINIKSKSFPTSIPIPEIESYCQKSNIANTSQISSVYKLTKASIQKSIPLCILSESGYGRNTGIHLMLNEKFKDPAQIHIVYCTSEISIDYLIGKYVYEGRLIFQIGPLLQAAVNGEAVILKNIDKLSKHAFSCIEAILNHLIDNEREVIIPGYDVSNYKISKGFCCLATVDGDDTNDIPRHVKKYFEIQKIPTPTQNDYFKICEALYPDLKINRPDLISDLITCFTSCMNDKDLFDLSFRMFIRILSSVDRLCLPGSPTEQAISLFALFQNVLYNNSKMSLLSNLNNKIKFNNAQIEKQINGNIYIENKQLIRGPLSCSLVGIDNIEKLKIMSKEKLNASFYIFSCSSPILMVGPTSFKETILKTLFGDIKVFFATRETSIGDIIGNISFKKNKIGSGRFGHGDIYDLLIEYMSMNFSTSNKITDINLKSPDSFQKIQKIIDDMEEGKLKPYFKYLYDIAKNDCEYATFFELGYVTRELMMGNIVLIKGIDQLSSTIIDNMIILLNDIVDLNEYIPGLKFVPRHSLFFTCSEYGYNKFSNSFLSRVQSVYIQTIRKEDIMQYVDVSLLDIYDTIIHDYSDTMKTINLLKIAEVLNNFNSPEERITAAQNIIENQKIDSLFFDNKKIYNLNDLIEYSKRTNELRSKRTGVKIFVDIYDDTNLKTIVFVPSVAYLLDLCIISLATHIPLIVESAPGQTKSTLIKYFGDAIGIKTKSMNMSRSRTSEELIGQIAPTEKGFEYKKGDLFEHIGENVNYLFDEINLSSLPLLSQILNVFKAPYDTKVVHPKDTKVYIKKFNLFATMNPAALTPNRIGLPQGFYSCSIVYKMPNYSKWDSSQIISSILCQFEDILEDYNNSLDFIVEVHKICMEKSSDVTIRDMIKLAELFQNYKNKNKESKIPKEKIASFVQLVYSSKITTWQDEFNNKKDKYSNKTNKVKMSKKLTKQQNNGMEQLIEALETNRGIILQGKSGTGKSYIIRNAAKKYFNGEEHKVHLIQLSAESDLSEIIGRYEPDYKDNSKCLSKLKKSVIQELENSSLSEDKETILSEYLMLLSKKEEITKTVKEMKSNPKIMEFPSIASRVNKFLDKSTIQLGFKYRDSPLITAMEKGDWVVLDFINLCPSDILETLNSLLEELHYIRVTKGTTEYIYSMIPQENMENVKEIKPNFRIIMTSDGRKNNSSNTLPTPFKSRCIELEIGNPSINDLPTIARSYFDVPIYADFLPKCFPNNDKNHVRDIIRMMKICKTLVVNTNLTPEKAIGKTIKYILDQKYIIPDTFIVPQKDSNDIIIEILSTIQTNLLNGNLSDKDFGSINAEIIKMKFMELKDCDQEDDIKNLFKATLHLACFVFSTKNYTSTKGIISERIITFLLCGYLLSNNKKNILPDFIWNLKFKPSVWDLLFINKNKYKEFTTKEGFLHFINSEEYDIGDFSRELFNFSKKDIKSYSTAKSEYLKMIDMLFKGIKIYNDQSILETDHKEKIIIENLPLSFPSIPDNTLIKDKILYSNIIEILQYLEIQPPYDEMIKSFNLDLRQYEISNDFDYLYNNTTDIPSSIILTEILLKYDQTYKILKLINEIQQNSKNIYQNLLNIFLNNQITIEIINKSIEEIKDYCGKNKNDVTDSIYELAENAEKIISRAYEQKRMNDLVVMKEKELFERIINIRQSIINSFIFNYINELIDKSPINDELLNQIEDMALLDQRIIKTNVNNYVKYKHPFIRSFGVSNNIIDILKYSVIVTSFIVPSSCDSFNIPSNICLQLIKKIGQNTICKLVNKINCPTELNKKEVNYHFLGKLIEKLKLTPIKMEELNDTNIISKIISFMDQYYMNTCIVSESSKPKEYIDLMMHERRETSVLKLMTHLSDDQKNIIIKQYSDLLDYKESSNDIKVTKDLIKKYCINIPHEDYGLCALLPFDVPINNNSISQIAHILTEQEARKYNIENKFGEKISLNNTDYIIIHTEQLLYNYLYLSFYNIVNQSLAKEFEIIDYIFKVLNPATPMEILQKDIILYLSKIKKNEICENEKEILKDSLRKIWMQTEIDIFNDNLYTLYNENYRKQMINYLKEKEQYEIYQKQTNNYSFEKEIQFINESIDKIICQNKILFLEIKTTFMYLLENETRENQNKLNGINGQKEMKNETDIVIELANVFLEPLITDSKYNGPYIHIKEKGNNYIDKYDKYEKSFFSNLYFKNKNNYKGFLNYDPTYVNTNKYNTFLKCNKGNKDCNHLHNIINNAKNIFSKFNLNYIQKAINYIKEIQKYPDHLIIQESQNIINHINTIKNMENIISKYKITQEPPKPQINFIPNSEPFKKICDMLMIVYENGKAHLLNEINYNIDKCYRNSNLIMNISNLTNATIKTEQPTQISQINDKIILSMNIKSENQKIDFINTQNNSNIGSIKFNCSFVEPEVYLVFSTPVIIKNNIIHIKGSISKQLSIFLNFNSTTLKHDFKFESLKGSEIPKTYVSIENTNNLIQFSFSEYGRFIAKMEITFSKSNIIISVLIDVNVNLKTHSLIFDAKTKKEILKTKKISKSEYFYVQSPKPPECIDCTLYPKINNIPYIHLVYTDCQSNIKSIYGAADVAFIESYFNLELYKNIYPKLRNFTDQYPYSSFYFRKKHNSVYLCNNNKYFANEIILKLNFQEKRLDSISFTEEFYQKKNFTQQGVIITELLKVDGGNQVGLLIQQIHSTQNVLFDINRDKIIPWVYILKLIDTTIDDRKEKYIKNIPENLYIGSDKSFYAIATESSVKLCNDIPDISINNSIKQNNIAIKKVCIDEYNYLESINCFDLFSILKNLYQIKLAMQLYRQFLDSKPKIASNLSLIYRIFKFLVSKSVMINTLNDIVSIGDKLFSGNNFSQNLEITIDNLTSESTEEIKFKYPKKNSDYKPKKENLIEESEIKTDPNENILPSYNKFDIGKGIDYGLRNKTFSRVNLILLDETLESDKKDTEKTVKKEDKNTIKINESSVLEAAPMNIDSSTFDESKSPRLAYNRALSKNPKLYELSNIEKNNKNLYVSDVPPKEGNIPNFDSYVFQILDILFKSEFSISTPKNHITLIFDISVLSGKNNKNLLATNMMVVLEMLNTFDITFSVWMFADRNLCFCVKKPNDLYDNARKTLIKDAYFLDRINQDSFVLSSITTICQQSTEKDSCLFIIFSTFISSQVLTPYMKWEEIALLSLNNRNIIGYIEPCQYIETIISNRLKESLRETSYLSYLTMSDICSSISNLLLKIFIMFKGCSKSEHSIIPNSLNIKCNKFINNIDFKSEIYICKNSMHGKKPQNSYSEKNELYKTKVEGNFEIINLNNLEFGDLTYGSRIFPPNKATKFELSSHGRLISCEGIIKLILSNFTNILIFKEKRGEKIREYAINIVVDNSTIIKKYSLNHCFLSVISLITSLKELEIPSVNLIFSGSKIISLLVNQDLKYISNEDPLYSKIYNILIENASESRTLDAAIKKVVSQKSSNIMSHLMFVITDALLGKDQENEIIDAISFAQLNGTTVIGIATGPTPYRMEEIFSWSIWSKNPYKTREALNKLLMSSITKNVFRPYDKLPTPKLPTTLPNLKHDIKNSDLLKKFADTEFYNLFITESLNMEAFDSKNFTGSNYTTDSNYDSCKNGKYEGFIILVMMFYQGKPGTADYKITANTFINGPPGMPRDTKSPGDKFKEKGFDYKIVTTYRESIQELISGKYHIAMLCTASTGDEKLTEDENYFESFRETIVKFQQEGGALVMFAENPPFIFEINHILQLIPNLQIRVDPKNSDPGGGIMVASSGDEVRSGEFLNCKYTFNAIINGIRHNCLPSLGGGLERLSEGKTLAKFINIDSSFKIFSRTRYGTPSCVYRVPLKNEGIIILDNGASKFFNEYTETGAARYINNLAMACVHYSNLRNLMDGNLNKKGIKINVCIRPRRSLLFIKPPTPLLITIIIDATFSMAHVIDTCKNKLRDLINECKSRVKDIQIYIQFVAYRDICDRYNYNGMIEKHCITSSPDSVRNFMNSIAATGGGDTPENIAAGFETALDQIESSSLKYKNIFILLGDAPSHYHDFNDSSHKSGNERGQSWSSVWSNINYRMSNLKIEKLITVSCDPDFDRQYRVWNNYGCYYINSILIKNSISNTSSLESIFVGVVAKTVQYMYQ